jgi:hypothetical protein
MAGGPNKDYELESLLNRVRAFRIEFFLWVIGFIGSAVCIQDALLDPPPDTRTMIIGGFFAGYIPITIIADVISKWGK